MKSNFVLIVFLLIFPTIAHAQEPTPTPELIAPIATNADWTPVERDFDDAVTMVLVPAGCFMMGSTQEYADELIAVLIAVRFSSGDATEIANAQLPQHEQCLDAPFWIDKTEVTQGDFARLGGVQALTPEFAGESRPVERITWYEARDFCALRGGRLPTEVEWEYAARGVDSWEYPWGDTWDANNAVWNRDRSQGTANVGSIPDGASWVGALDMSGNVYEWTSSQYESYPYDATDGREVDTGRGTDVRRVLRGGSLNMDDLDLLRAAFRDRLSPAITYYFFGFRCVRSE